MNFTYTQPVLVQSWNPLPGTAASLAPSPLTTCRSPDTKAASNDDLLRKHDDSSLGWWDIPTLQLKTPRSFSISISAIVQNHSKTICTDSMHRQGAQTGCTDRVHRQGAQTVCTDRVHRQYALTVCTDSMHIQGAHNVKPSTRMLNYLYNHVFVISVHSGWITSIRR